MGVRSALAAVAGRAPVPVFAIAGRGTRERAQDLLLDPAVDVVDSPRPANVLLLTGDIPSALLPPAVVAHDAMSHPRCTVWWRLGTAEDHVTPNFPRAIVVEEEDVVPALRRVHRDLLEGSLPSEPPVLPDVDPAPWRGVGPYGQGGSGMTGGVPYGRPMPDRAEDRDGLMLDQLAVRIGPLLPALPAGLTLDVKLQGDVIQEVSIETDDSSDARGSIPPLLRPFLLAMHDPVPVAELELARARSHLRWIAWALRVHGLPALAERALRLAHRVGPGDGGAVRSLARSVRRTRVLGWSARGVGVVPAEGLSGLGLGPVARASGADEDARAGESSYRGLGFETIVHDEGDAAARWRQRLAEAAQSLDLADRAGDRSIEPAGRVEGPHGLLQPGDAPADRLLPLLPEILAGLEWGDAVTTLASLDLELEEATSVARARAEVTS